MAFTTTILKKTVFGDERTHHLTVTTDAAEGVVTTGLSYIDGFTLTPGSLSTGTAYPHVFTNVGSTATATGGTLGVSGATSGDLYYITVFGR